MCCTADNNEIWDNILKSEQLDIITSQEKAFDMTVIEEIGVFKLAISSTLLLNLHKATKKIRCHYYNNTKPCPFDEIGCMFLHEKSKLCKNADSCQMKLYQFKQIESMKNEMSIESMDNEMSTTVIDSTVNDSPECHVRPKGESKNSKIPRSSLLKSHLLYNCSVYKYSAKYTPL